MLEQADRVIKPIPPGLAAPPTSSRLTIAPRAGGHDVVPMISIMAPANVSLLLGVSDTDHAPPLPRFVDEVHRLTSPGV